MRLNVVKSTNSSTIFRDYAHAPSKVEATAIAVKSQFPDRELVGVFELHTYSSLNKDFLSHYADTLKYCNEAIVYYNPKVIAQKKLTEFEPQDVIDAFKHPHLRVINKTNELESALQEIELVDKNILLMSSANFGGLNINNLF